MHNPAMASQADESQWLRSALHDISQPMTALECGLYIGTMTVDGNRTPQAEELMATIRAALEQCHRVSSQLRLMQERLHSQH